MGFADPTRMLCAVCAKAESRHPLAVGSEIELKALEPATEDVVFLGNLVIHATSSLVEISTVGGRCEKICVAGGEVRLRDKSILYFQRDRIQPRLGNNVSREGQTG